MKSMLCLFGSLMTLALLLASPAEVATTKSWTPGAIKTFSAVADDPNPADLLGSQKIDQIIAGLLSEADIILFDAPPVIAVTDATVLGSKVDGVLLVISAGKTRREHAARAKELLERANVRVIGAALTNAPKDSSIGGYYD